MLISNFLPASALVLALTQTALGNPVPAPVSDADDTGFKALATRDELGHGLSQGDWYDHISSRMIEYHKVKRVQHEELSKRSDTDFRAQGYTSSWGYHSYWGSHGCGSGWNKRWYYGTLVRTITFPNNVPGNRTFWWWANHTYYHVAHTDGSTGTPCFRYGRPQHNYHSTNNDNINQCTDSIYSSHSSNTKTPRPSASSTLGWANDPVTYPYQNPLGNCGSNKCRTRKIYDCLLNQTAYEYQGVHPDIGKSGVVRYTHPEGHRHYRFYDSNNFAWFVMCPSEDYLRRTKQKRCFPSCPTNSHNPIWDFLPEKLHNPLADATPLADYEDYLTDRNRYGIDRVNLVSYWPPSGTRQIEVDGRPCLQMAVSRPGLRHWSVKWFDPSAPNKAFPAREDEWAWKQGLWVNLNEEDYSHSKSLNEPN